MPKAEPATVIGLDDRAASRVELAGAKGAGLAQARAAGMPVLDGFVVAPAVSEPALVQAAEVMEHRGTGGARMAIIGAELPESVLEAIAQAASVLSEPLIVRSSSILEGGGLWSGAFTSVPEVLRNEVPKAVRSVWATCFSLEVLDRYEAEDIEPAEALMGVLVQPEILPDFGGAARSDADGTVRIDAVKGSPRDLMAGWSPGVRAEVIGQNVTGSEAVDLMGAVSLLEVAELARRVRQEMDCGLIEWAFTDDRVLLLQVQRSNDSGPEGSMVVPAALSHPLAQEFARLAHRYPGPLGEELVLGWLPALGDVSEWIQRSPRAAEGAGSGAPKGEAREAMLQRARMLAAELMEQAWAEPAHEAAALAQSVLRRMRSDRPNESIDALGALNPVDRAKAAELLTMADALIASEKPTGRRGIGRWEPLLAGVAALQGRTYQGRGAVGGVGAGRMVWVGSPRNTDHVAPRDIIVTQYPLANFAPLLFDAAGIVALGGASTAHLFEVARALTVPAVIECPLGDVIRGGTRLGMLDGDAGCVAVLEE